MALAPLTYCAVSGITPSIVITNDWPCGLVATYARMYYNTTSLKNASFFHIIHNLDECYEGRIYPEGDEKLENVHGLPLYLLQDPYWKSNILNPSRCALLSTDIGELLVMCIKMLSSVLPHSLLCSVDFLNLSHLPTVFLSMRRRLNI